MSAINNELIVTRQGFPHGVRCGDCNEQLALGERYFPRAEGMIGDALLTVIVCLRCADSKGEIL